MRKYFCTKCGSTEGFIKEKRGFWWIYELIYSFIRMWPRLGLISEVYMINKKYCKKCGSDSLIKLNNKIDKDR
jgi:hypothetical protein